MCMRYLNITDCDIANGRGVRVTLYVSGCSHRCPQCHNPESWNCNNGKIFTQDTLKLIFSLLDRPYIDGITLSGGDPLFSGNREDILKICKEIKKNFPDKNIWMYTGYEYEEIQDLPVLKYVDVLVDGRFKFMLKDTTLAFRGSSNQRIIDLNATREKKKIVTLDY